MTGWTNLGALGSAANAVTGLGIVTYDTANTINGNPTVYFNSGALNTNNTMGIDGRKPVSLFVVTKIASNGYFVIGPQLATNRTFDWLTSPTYDRLKLYNDNTFYSGSNARSINLPAISTTKRSGA